MICFSIGARHAARRDGMNRDFKSVDTPEHRL
jgi:hypothetical protein